MSILNKLKLHKKQKAEELETGADKTKPNASANFKSVLVRQAWATEKASDLSSFRKYVFIVDKKTSKPEIKKAIESIYGVKIIGINIINTKGKAKRLGRSLGRTSAFKKAVVTLKEGQKIEIMPT